MQTIRIGAHRGAMRHAPENTLAAFEKAIEFGTWRIECDVRRAGDGTLVMMHDATVDRTTDGQGEVAQMSLEALRRLRLGASGTVPTLDETLACARGRTRLLLELKDKGIAADVVAAVRTADMAAACTLISFHEEELREARRLAPEIAVGFFHIEPKPIDMERVVSELGASLLVVWPAAAEPEIVAAAVDAGLQVRCGLKDDLSYDEAFEIFRRMVAMGISEVSCGRPDWIGRMIAATVA